MGMYICGNCFDRFHLEPAHSNVLDTMAHCEICAALKGWEISSSTFCAFTWEITRTFGSEKEQKENLEKQLKEHLIWILMQQLKNLRMNVGYKKL
jgi:hypothetical protein